MQENIEERKKITNMNAESTGVLKSFFDILYVNTLKLPQHR